MSNAELALQIETSPQYRDWLRRERQSRLTVRAVQLALLLVGLFYFICFFPRKH